MSPSVTTSLSLSKKKCNEFTFFSFFSVFHRENDVFPWENYDSTRKTQFSTHDFSTFSDENTVKTAESFEQILKSKMQDGQIFPANSTKNEPFIGVEPKNLSYLLGILQPKLNINKNQQQPLPKDYQASQKIRTQKTAMNTAQAQIKDEPKPLQKLKDKITETRKPGPAHKLNSAQRLSLEFFCQHNIKLPADFTANELKQAYRLLALKLHPDRAEGCPESFIRLKNHYENLIKCLR